MKNLEIYTNQDKAGTLAKESNKYIFTYDNSAKNVVSVTMPIRVQSWVSDKLHPIFEMNLPEGALKDALRERFSKIMPMDNLGMLKLIGPYVIGRVKYGKPELSNEVTALDDILDNSLHVDSKRVTKTGVVLLARTSPQPVSKITRRPSTSMMRNFSFSVVSTLISSVEKTSGSFASSASRSMPS